MTPTRSLVVVIVDACLRDGHGGSPTAVVSEQPLTDAERRAIPGLAGTSHAVFIAGQREEGRPRAALRFFTSAGELPGCGHGTVAALALLAGDGEFQGRLTAGGRSFVATAGPEGEHMRAAFDPGSVQLREARIDERELALGALGAGIPAGQIWLASVGRSRLLVPVSDRSVLAGLRLDQERLRAGCDRLGLLGCFVYSPPSPGGRLAARMFAPAIGVPEDIANANSTACLAARLARLGITELSVDMGDALGRPATITATARQSGSGIEIRVGGTARVAQTLELGLDGQAPGPTASNAMR